MVDADTRALRAAARTLLQSPLLCAERDADAFTEVRRNEVALDRLFTQRLGYRLHVSSRTARLYKTTALVHRRTLNTVGSAPRAMTQRELVVLTLVLAAVAAGPRVISLRDLVGDVHSAAADAQITLGNEPADRRAFVTVLKWMIATGLAAELHETVGRYETDADADAVLEIDPDRVALLPLPVLSRAETSTELLDRDGSRSNTRQWLRARLVEDPVLYADDVTEAEWSELRRRLGEERALLEDMFGLQLEARAEGILAIDPAERLTDLSFPAANTLNHAALLLLDALTERGGEAGRDEVETMLAAMIERHARHWSRSQTASVPALADRIVRLLGDLRLLSVNGTRVRTLPAAARYAVEERGAGDGEGALAARPAAVGARRANAEKAAGTATDRTIDNVADASVRSGQQGSLF